MDELIRLAEQQYPDRPINLPEGPAVVVPVPERRAFIAGAAWQAVGVTSPPQPPGGRTGFKPPHGGFVTAYEDVETRARELAGSWAVTPPESKAFTDCADAIAALRRERDGLLITIGELNDLWHLNVENVAAAERARDECRSILQRAE